MSNELRRITYVEDEADIRTVAELALEQIGGFTVDICESGEEALRRIPAFRPDLILLDVMMSDLGGLETYRALRSIPEFAARPIVFMTAKAQKHEVESYMRLGAAGVIAKPFDPLRLADEVRAIWQRASTEESSPCKSNSGHSFESTA